MAEKTTFSDMVPDASRVTLPERCCGKCAHGRVMTDPSQLGRRMVMCKAGPPTPILMLDKGGRPMVQSNWPILDLAEPGCDLFALPAAANDGAKEQNPPSVAP